MSGNPLIEAFAQENRLPASSLLPFMLPQAAGVGMGIKGLDGRYQLVNPAMGVLLGETIEQIRHKTDHHWFPADVVAQLLRSDQQIIDGAPATSDELDLSINGVPRRCLWLKFPVIGQDGKIVSIGSVLIDSAYQEDVVEMRQTLERLQQANQALQDTLVELDHLASTDKLTGAWNRRRLEETVRNEMARLKRYAHPLCLLVIDIDFFKRINDQHGHGAGDQVLAKLAAVIQATIRTTDSLTRWGGEEFVVLSPNTTLSTMAIVAERLRERIAQETFPAVNKITVSVGVAECMAGETWEQWFNRADAALYRAKACGRNQVQIAPETPQRLGVGEHVAANFVQLSWHAAYECGHPLIDDQHRRLFQHANDLLTAILSARPDDEVAAQIDSLIHSIVQHFQDEEAIFTAAGFPHALEHAAIHHKLVETAITLVERFQAGTLAIGELFQFLAHDVVARHMLGADREFFPYLKH